MSKCHLYKGFQVIITPEMEPTESRIKRGDWQSKILGYGYRVYYRSRICFSVERPEQLLSTQEDAIADFENRVDAILDSV